MKKLKGEGNEETPYKLSKSEHINHIKKAPDRHYEITSDIEFDDGSKIEIPSTFYGTLDGRGHEIRGLEKEIVTINKGKIMNISITNAVVDKPNNSVGIVASKNYGKILNIEIKKSKIQGRNRTGSISGENYSSIKNCSVTSSDIITKIGTGGIVGTNYSGKIENCSVNDTTCKGKSNVGGIVGENIIKKEKAQIKDCLVKNVSVIGRQGNSSGGIAGENGGDIKRCKGKSILVNSISYSGGIAGFNHNGKILRCEVDGRIKGEEKIGGISGYNNGDIKKCASQGEIIGIESVGGIVGENKNRVIKSYFKGEIEAKKGSNQKYIGAIIGTNDSNGNIKNCHYCGKSEYPLISKKEGTKEDISSNEKIEEINKRIIANEI